MERQDSTSTRDGVGWSWMLLTTLTAFSCAPEPPSVGAQSQALSAAQCDYFEVGGSVTICHRTPSPKHPVVKIKVSLDNCILGHALHKGDYVAVDGDCGAGACLAEGAPCDSTLPCCAEACGADGLCPFANLCLGAPPCTAEDQCHEVGTCNPATGLCSNPEAPAGTPCSDGNACSLGDLCVAGSCHAGGPFPCDDHNDCTEDSCEPAGGCVHTPIYTAQCCTVDLSTLRSCEEGESIAIDPVTYCPTCRPAPPPPVECQTDPSLIPICPPGVTPAIDPVTQCPTCRPPSNRCGDPGASCASDDECCSTVCAAGACQ